MSSFLQNLTWRRAVKKFIPGPPIDTTPITNAIVAAPTSFGLQPYKVLAIRDQATKEKLRAVSFGQAQVTDCDTLFVFCAHTNPVARAEEYLTVTGAEGMRGMLMGYLNSLHDLTAWASKQAYIALGFALAAAAEAKIPSCPMEGFVPTQVHEILNLPTTLQPVALLAVGHVAEGDDGTYPRFRFPADDLIEKA